MSLKNKLKEVDSFSRKMDAISLRALIVGALLIPVNVFWIMNIEYVAYTDNVSTSALFFNCIWLLVLLLGLNAIWGRLSPNRNFSRAELLTIYTMLVISTALCGHDQMEILFTGIHYPLARATEDNGWVDSILPNLPSHLIPEPGPAISNLYRGQSTLYKADHIIPWLRPIGWWSLFLFAFVWVMMCLSAIFRRQWAAEKLTYPIAEIPLQITDPKTKLFRNKLFWLAFGLAAAIRIMVLLHLVYPSVPEIPVGVKYYPIAKTWPWSAAGHFPLCFFPFAIGLCFFLPTQISFSIWFFTALARLEMVAAAARGASEWGAFPYIGEQSAGAGIGLALTLIWYARKHLVEVAKCAFGRIKMDDTEEPLSYRTAVFGLIIGFLFMAAFAIMGGMRPLTAIIYLIIVHLFVLVVARLRAEVGIPTIEFYLLGSDNLLRVVGGDSAWTKGEVTMMSLFFFMTRTSRQFPMSSQMDGIRISEKAGIKARGITIALMIACVITIVTAFWSMLHVMYQVGYESAAMNPVIIWAFGDDPWQRAHQTIVLPRQPDFGRALGYGFGALFTFLLTALRVQFPGSPFHPVGYMVAGLIGVNRFWAPMFIAWLVKAPMLRYGGLKIYRRAVPFFIGLILGEFITGMMVTFLSLFGIIFPPGSGIGGL